jgi:hypothetical protein
VSNLSCRRRGTWNEKTSCGGWSRYESGRKDKRVSDEPAYVPVDSDTLLGYEGYEKLVKIAFLLSGGLEYEGFYRWLAMWPDIDTALAEARKLASSPFI